MSENYSGKNGEWLTIEMRLLVKKQKRSQFSMDEMHICLQLKVKLSNYRKYLYNLFSCYNVFKFSANNEVIFVVVGSKSLLNWNHLLEEHWSFEQSILLINQNFMSHVRGVRKWTNLQNYRNFIYKNHMLSFYPLRQDGFYLKMHV